MNENLNLVEILKDCPSGTKLYSTIYGNVELVEVYRMENAVYPIKIRLHDNFTEDLTKDGKMFVDCGGECTLFPSREERNWSKFNPKKPRFDPKTLKPFDRILVRANEKSIWHCCLFSHIDYDSFFPIKIAGDSYKYAVPYNEETKHLVGTDKEAPEYYRYWDVV